MNEQTSLHRSTTTVAKDYSDALVVVGKGRVTIQNVTEIRVWIFFLNCRYFCLIYCRIVIFLRLCALKKSGFEEEKNN